jgi:probable rRNA maturation factor
VSDDPPGSSRAYGDPSMPVTGRRRRLPDEGTLEVAAYDEQRDHRVDITRWRDLASRVLEAEGVNGDAELALLFVDEATITDLNRRFMDKDEPTDVLSFPIDDPGETGRWPDGSSSGPRREPTEVPLLLGDVVLCPAVAARQAPDHAGTYDDELALLVVHGVLHILGLDHATPGEEAAMQERERQYLQRFHGPLPSTAWPAAARPT